MRVGWTVHVVNRGRGFALASFGTEAAPCEEQLWTRETNVSRDKADSRVVSVLGDLKQALPAISRTGISRASPARAVRKVAARAAANTAEAARAPIDKSGPDVVDAPAKS